MKNLTVTIGIPAYNEEDNIGYLLKELLLQEQNGFHLQKIIVSSDGSTDKTAEITSRIKNKYLRLFDNKKRRGIATRLNQIIKYSKSDILVIIDADTLIRDKKFIHKVIQPIIANGADLTSCRMEELKPRNFFENVLVISMKIKNFAFENYRSGNNPYNCHGQARAFSKRLYKKISFLHSLGEDAYSYFYCIENDFKFAYVKSTKIFYRLPDNFSDHERQSIRFFQSQRIMAKDFGEEFVKSQYFLPRRLFLQALSCYFVKFPLHVSSYIFLTLLIKMKSIIQVVRSDQIWTIATSSKHLVNLREKGF